MDLCNTGGKGRLYTINTRFLQDQVEGLFVSRRLYLDGEIPFEEANNLEFLYSSSWQVGTFSDGTTEFEFYLSEGEHTMKLEVNLGNLGEIISEIRDCVTQINSIYIKILQFPARARTRIWITAIIKEFRMKYRRWV